MAEGPARLVVLAHGPTRAASQLVLADAGPLLRPLPARRPAAAVTSWVRAPEPASAQTLAALDVEGEVLADLALPDLGTWTGRLLADLAAADPAGLQAWLGDPTARPHGGETLTELVARLGALLAGRPWPGRTGVVVAPLVARALTVAALGAPAALVLALDVGHDGQLLLSRSGTGWRLQELLRRDPPAVWSAPG